MTQRALCRCLLSNHTLLIGASSLAHRGRMCWGRVDRRAARLLCSSRRTGQVWPLRPHTPPGEMAWVWDHPWEAGSAHQAKLPRASAGRQQMGMTPPQNRRFWRGWEVEIVCCTAGILQPITRPDHDLDFPLLGETHSEAFQLDGTGTPQRY